jgi:HSP20 family protein
MNGSRENSRELATQFSPTDSVFGNLAKEIDDAMRTWITSPSILTLFESDGLRMPLCEIEDKRDSYVLQVEVPGIDKENVEIKAEPHSIEVFAKKSRLTNSSNKGTTYTERSESSFYRSIPLPEEVVPQKIRSSIKNGILNITVPKKPDVSMNERRARRARQKK